MNGQVLKKTYAKEIGIVYSSLLFVSLRSCLALFLAGLLSGGSFIFFCQNASNIEIIQDVAEAGVVFGEL